MQIIENVSQLRKLIEPLKQSGSKVGLIPTMGFLHQGHRALIEASVKQCDVSVVSIFVNPTQFNPNEDLSRYPRNLDADAHLCSAANADFIFVPKVREVYPRGYQTFVEPGQLASGLCGAFRPGHFRGVATIVAKLFNMVQPDYAYFGAKDFQQARVIEQMVIDLNFPVNIQKIDIVRESDGLAMSSRNVYLSQSERKRALSLSQGLMVARQSFNRGERDPRHLVDLARAELDVDQVQYMEVVRESDLQSFAGMIDAPAVMALAIFIGTTRLIDNITLGA